MFTGIIEEIGVVKNLRKSNSSAVLSVEAEKVCSDAATGDSIANNGVCLTVIQNNSKIIDFDVSTETLDKSNIGELTPGDKVNLERALKVGSRLGGHFVTGHIDCVAKIIKKTTLHNTVKVEFELPAQIDKYLVPKGSIAIDGISLTIGEVTTKSFNVFIIPHTLENTTLSFKKENASVNLEADVLAKYIEKSNIPIQKTPVSKQFLSKHGFM